jgi:hypothetical protein
MPRSRASAPRGAGSSIGRKWLPNPPCSFAAPGCPTNTPAACPDRHDRGRNLDLLQRRGGSDSRARYGADRRSRKKSETASRTGRSEPLHHRRPGLLVPDRGHGATSLPAIRDRRPSRESRSASPCPDHESSRTFPSCDSQHPSDVSGISTVDRPAELSSDGFVEVPDDASAGRYRRAGRLWLHPRARHRADRWALGWQRPMLDDVAKSLPSGARKERPQKEAHHRERPRSGAGPRRDSCDGGCCPVVSGHRRIIASARFATLLIEGTPHGHK